MTWIIVGCKRVRTRLTLAHGLFFFLVGRRIPTERRCSCSSITKKLKQEKRKEQEKKRALVLWQEASK